MAAISLSDCSIYRKVEGEVEVAYIKTPSTADSADTIDTTDLLNGRDVVGITGWDVTAGDEATATFELATDIITVDAAGGTTDHVYVVKVEMLR